LRSKPKADLKPLYPAIDAYKFEYLEVSGGHTLYLEQSGNPNGYPIIFVHGGPGGGTSPLQRRFFNPKKFRIILFDQRGCGKSRPHASVDHNTTWDLVNDIEAIRQHLSLSKFAFMGGSWGSTLALIYAINHPDRVTNMVLRGIFLMRQKELDWFYGGGTGAIFPEAWDRFISPIPVHERGNLIEAYHKRLFSDDIPRSEQLMHAKEWSLWEASTVTSIPDTNRNNGSIDPTFAFAFARIEAHFFANCGFLEDDNYILNNVDKLKSIDTTIVQGRCDAICPPVSAYDLKRAMPWAKLSIVDRAGHSAFEPEIADELVRATDRVSC
jgi:proline iminopeptidase